MSKTTCAVQLKKGDLFMLPKGRKFKTVSEVFIFTDKDLVPEEDKGKLLICFNGCNQMVLSPTDVVIIPNHQL